MTISRRNKIIIAVIVVVIAVVFGLFWWLGGRGPRIPETNINEPFSPERLPVTVNTNTTPSLVKEAAVEATLKAVATTFTERYGSYSNQSNFGNLNDLRSLLTIKMRGTIDSLIAQQQSSVNVGDAYYGITTQALTTTITAYDESLGRADVVVNTQRQESKGSTANPRIFYQKINLKLVNTSDGWKVDEASWQ